MNIDLRSLPQITNSAYYPLYLDVNRYMVLYGGAGSGKSVFASQNVVFRILTERNHRVLIVRKVGTTMRESVFALMKQTLSTFGIFHLCRVNKTDMTISLPLFGSEILFKSIDDPEKIKSITDITLIWIEEASDLTQQDFQQLDLRLRGKTKHAKQIMVSFNPIDVNHWLKRMFFDVRRDDTTVIHTTYKDNAFIDVQYVATLEKLRTHDEYYYNVYALGQWGVLGKTIFPAQIVSERIAYLQERKPLRIGFFAFETDASLRPVLDKIQWIDDPTGAVRIYENPSFSPYVLGGDTAGEGSDYFTAHVINNTTGNQAATLRQQLGEIEYAQQCYCLANHYHGALVGIEVNFSSYPTRKFEEWNYPHMYVREAQDSFTHALEKRYGFMTTKFTRPLIIAELVTLVKESVHLLHDVATLDEMLTFVRNENGRAEAKEGAHDDLLIALAITYHIRTQQAYSVTKSVNFDLSKMPEDYQQDYENADEEGKRYLLRKWGMTG